MSEWIRKEDVLYIIDSNFQIEHIRKAVEELKGIEMFRFTVPHLSEYVPIHYDAESAEISALNVIHADDPEWQLEHARLGFNSPLADLYLSLNSLAKGEDDGKQS